MKIRGGYRGGRRGGPPRGGFGGMPPSISIPTRPPPFDIFNAKDAFEKISAYDEAPLTQDVTARGEALALPEKDRLVVLNLWNKVESVIEKIIAKPEMVEGVKIEEVRKVGSYRKDTVLVGNNVADLAVVMSSLPSFESVAALGTKIAEELRALPEKETVSSVTREYGCLIAGTNAQVRLLITTLPSNVALLEPDLHLPEKVMMFNFHSIRHAAWFEEASTQSPLKILVRVMKDVRRRFKGLQPLSVWALEFLCHFCLLHTPNRVPLSLGPAFRRVFQSLSAGIFLPGSPGLIDPTEPGFRIAFDLTFEEMDEVCCTAQTLLRVISNGGQSAVLGTSHTTSDVSKTNSTWNGVSVSPLEVAYVADCMKPKFCDEDEALAEKLAATKAQ